MKRKNNAELQLTAERLICISLIALVFSGCLRTDSWFGIPVNYNAYDMSFKTVSRSVMTLKSFPEKFIYLSFGYLSCRGICPGTGASLYRLSRELHDNDIIFLFGEMMPEKNRLEKVQNHLNLFGERFTAFTADSEETMRSNAGKFHEYFDSGRGQISHTGNIYLIDGSRNIRLIYPDTCRDAYRMKEDYEKLRKEYGRK